MINSNMGCIETCMRLRQAQIWEEINSNMGCIETGISY